MIIPLSIYLLLRLVLESVLFAVLSRVRALTLLDIASILLANILVESVLTLMVIVLVSSHWLVVNRLIVVKVTIAWVAIIHKLTILAH